MTPDIITVDQFIAAPPQAVWDTITTPELLARWWAPGDIRAEVGHEFLVEMPGWGNVVCTVLEAEPPHLLVFTFADWTLRWRLEPEGAGTRLFLEHSGFDLDDAGHRFAFDNMGPGWRDEVLPLLATVAQEATAAR
ncbi:MAG: SRPBCC domain-containing protein [Acidimicrobiia bacterium]|nr:SRPBCC domain-containing protein [Acidimicrobiia bacterium]